MEKTKQMRQLSVKMPESLEPVYSNLIRISHGDDEFTLTFLHRIPDSNLALGRAIVTLSPQHAKRFLRALEANIKKYESTFGDVRLPEDVEPKEGGSVEVV